MNLFVIIKLAHQRINRTVSSEAKRIARQAWLGLKKMAGENPSKLFFSYAARVVIGELLKYLFTHYIK